MQVTPYRKGRIGASGPGPVAYHEPMRTDDGPAAVDSPLGVALARIGDRWSPRIIEALLDGPLRYGELQAAVTAIAPNILADRLRRLEADRLLTSTAYAERPPRFEYRLTADGRALAGALRLLAEWGALQAGGDAAHASMLHEPCGTVLEARWYCPTCGVVAGSDLEEPSRHV
jgi:DNA-binding HxlR family transcriptional regulator